MTITYAQRISNQLATLRSDNSARGACEAIAAEADAEIERLRADAARYRWLRRTTNFATGKGGRIDVRDNPELWDRAIDAAIAKETQ